LLKNLSFSEFHNEKDDKEIVFEKMTKPTVQEDLERTKKG
jgi:hypothetical protein